MYFATFYSAGTIHVINVECHLFLTVFDGLRLLFRTVCMPHEHFSPSNSHDISVGNTDYWSREE
jgi:hypothetical protein